MQVIDIQQKLDSFDDHWSPRVIAALNGQHVKVVKLLGEFDWHFHKDEDELFMVVEGELTLHFRDRTIELTPGKCASSPGVSNTNPWRPKNARSCYSNLQGQSTLEIWSIYGPFLHPTQSNLY